METEISTNSGAASLSDAFLGHAHETSSLFSAHVTAIDMSAFAQRNKVLMGTLSGSIEGVQLTGAALAKQVAETARRANGGKKKDSVADFLAMLDTQIAWLDRQMGQIEQELVAQFGEGWAEQVALEILDPDVVPQRQEGEAMTDYQGRVEQALVLELLDENGNIKPEYANHPRYGQAAQWAQYRFDRNAAVDLREKLNDPETSPAEARQEIDQFSETAPCFRMQASEQELATNAVASATLEERTEERVDLEESTAAFQTADDAFLSGPIG